MVYRKRSRSNYARRNRAPQRYRRKQAYRKQRKYRLRKKASNLLYCPNGIPNRAMVCLTAGDQLNTTLLAISKNVWTFQTGKSFLAQNVGRELQGWDQFKLLYSFYRVRAMKVMFRLYPSGAHPLLLGAAYTSRYNTDVGNSVTEASDKYTKLQATGTNSNGIFYQKFWRANQPLGLSNEQYRTDNTTEASTATNPTVMSFYHVVIRQQNSTTTLPCLINYRVKMWIEFTEPIFLGDA